MLGASRQGRQKPPVFLIVCGGGVVFAGETKHRAR